MKQTKLAVSLAVGALAVLPIGCTINLGTSSPPSPTPQSSSAPNPGAAASTSTTAPAPNLASQPSTPAISANPPSGEAPSSPVTPISDGKQFTWQGHGVTVTVPSTWRMRQSSTGQVSFAPPYASKGASLSVDELVAKPGPVNAGMVTSDYEFQQSQLKAGKRSEARYLTIDGVRGSYALDAESSEPLGTRTLRWKGFRTYQGRPQLLSVLLMTTNRDYPSNAAIMQQVLNNLKFTE